MKYQNGNIWLNLDSFGHLQASQMPADAVPIGCDCAGSVRIELLMPDQTIQYVTRHFFVWERNNYVRFDLPDKTMENEWEFAIIGSFTFGERSYNVAYLKDYQC